MKKKPIPSGWEALKTFNSISPSEDFQGATDLWTWRGSFPYDYAEIMQSLTHMGMHAHTRHTHFKNHIIQGQLVLSAPHQP